jgi:hypothetical protein
MVVGFITTYAIIYGKGKFVGDFNMGTLLRNMD